MNPYNYCWFTRYDGASGKQTSTAVPCWRRDQKDDLRQIQRRLDRYRAHHARIYGDALILHDNDVDDVSDSRWGRREYPVDPYLRHLQDDLKIHRWERHRSDPDLTTYTMDLTGVPESLVQELVDLQGRSPNPDRPELRIKKRCKLRPRRFDRMTDAQLAARFDRNPSPC